MKNSGNLELLKRSHSNAFGTENDDILTTEYFFKIAYYCSKPIRRKYLIIPRPFSKYTFLLVYLVWHLSHGISEYEYSKYVFWSKKKYYLNW